MPATSAASISGLNLSIRNGLNLSDRSRNDPIPVINLFSPQGLITALHPNNRRDPRLKIKRERSTGFGDNKDQKSPVNSFFNFKDSLNLPNSSILGIFYLI